MIQRSIDHFPRRLRRLGVVLALAVTAGLGGCGAGDAPDGFGRFFDITIASTEAGGGDLVAAYDFDEAIEVTFVQCLGGTGPACTGGVRLYAAEDPGFDALRRDRVAQSLFALPEGVGIRIEITAAEPEASLFLSNQVLQNAGDETLIGATPEGVHKHGSWQLAIPGDQELEADYALSFRLRTDDGFGDSAEYVVLLTPIG